MASYSGLATSTRCASFTPCFRVLLHFRPVETSLYQGSSPYYSLVCSHSVMMVGLKNLGSERLGCHHFWVGFALVLKSLSVWFGLYPATTSLWFSRFLHLLASSLQHWLWAGCETHTLPHEICIMVGTLGDLGNSKVTLGCTISSRKCIVDTKLRPASGSSSSTAARG